MIGMNKMTSKLQALVFAPVLAATFWVLPHGTAWAEECLDPVPAGWLAPPDVTPPSIEDRLAITDLISQFYWARDEKYSVILQDFFTDDIVYELCTAGGSLQLAARTGVNDVDSHLGDLTGYLNSHNLWTRHIVSNLILSEVDDDTVLGKATVLVLLQNAYSETPTLDYTAILKAEFRREAEDESDVNSDTVWRFGSMTVQGDSAALGASGVRGR